MPKKKGKENAGLEKLEIHKSFYFFDRKNAEEAIAKKDITLPGVISAIKESTIIIGQKGKGAPLSDNNFSEYLGDFGGKLWKEKRVILEDVTEWDIESIRNRKKSRAPDNISEAIIMAFGFSGNVARNIRNAETSYNKDKKPSVAVKLGPRQRAYEQGHGGKPKSGGWER